MTHEIDKRREWYLDPYASRYIYNNHKSFSNLQSKLDKFVTIGRNIIRLNQVKIVTLPLENNLELILSNVADTLKCNFNLILLGQLQETSISYHDHPKYIVL